MGLIIQGRFPNEKKWKIKDVKKKTKVRARNALQHEVNNLFFVLSQKSHKRD